MARNPLSPSVILSMDDDLPHPVEVDGGAGWNPGSGTLSVRISPASEDTSGQMLAGSEWVEIVVEGEDVEAHSLSLRFPSPDDAARFQRKLLLTGTLAGTLLIGAVAAGGAMSQATSNGSNAAAVGAQAATGTLTIGALREPAVAPGLAAEGIRPIAAPAPAMPPGLRAEAAQPAAPRVPLKAPAIAPGLRAETVAGAEAGGSGPTDGGSGPTDGGGAFRGR
ncbi:MAG TPA: hypothetical protein VFI28_05440 [Candidatus Limnocylindrales bacterium]|nr:hypothetical protein [Candidatus Limnocylindrales bacterium]